MNNFPDEKNNLIPCLPGLASKLSAQKCLDISISTMMDKIETPVDAEASFKKCLTKKNDHNQVVIINRSGSDSAGHYGVSYWT